MSEANNQVVNENQQEVDEGQGNVNNNNNVLQNIDNSVNNEENDINDNKDNENDNDNSNNKSDDVEEDIDMDMEDNEEPFKVQNRLEKFKRLTKLCNQYMNLNLSTLEIPEGIHIITKLYIYITIFKVIS